MRVKFFTSSHGREDYGLPEKFRSLFSSHASRFGDFQVSAQSGQVMCLQTAQKIIADMKSWCGPQIVVLGLGDNNLRPRGLKKGHSGQEILDCHRLILESAADFQNVQVVIVGLLPCLKYDDVTKKPFKDTSYNLKKMTREYSFAFFFDIAKYFMNRETIKPTCFTDGIHLSLEGQTIYSDKVFKFILALPKLK